MFKQFCCSLLAALLVLLYPAGAGRSAPPISPGEIHEEFDTTAARNWSMGVAWDTTAGALRLERQTGENQFDPRVLPGPDGSLLAFWRDDRAPNRGVFAQRFSADGQPLWPDSRFLTAAEGYEAALLPGGGFALAYTARPNDHMDIFAMRFDDQAQPVWSEPVRVNTDRGTQWQISPDIAARADGSMYVVWTDFRTAGRGSQIFGQRLSSAGDHLWSVDKKVSPDSLNYGDWHFDPKAAVDSTGSLVVVWLVQYGGTVPESEDYEFSAVRAQRMSSGGSRLWRSGNGVEIVPKLYTEHWFSFEVVALPGGGSLAVFTGFDPAGDGGILARRLANDGKLVWSADRMLVSSEFMPDLYGLPNQIEAILDSTGSLGLFWRSRDSQLYFQRFNQEAAPLITAPVPVGPGGSAGPVFSAAGLSDGSAALAWEEPQAEDAQYVVYLQRTGPDGQLLWGPEVVGEPGGPAGESYQTRGETASVNLNTSGEEIERAVLTAGVTLNGGQAFFELSNDGGDIWLPAVPGQEVTLPQGDPDLRWKVTLVASADYSQTPQVDWLHIVYTPKELPPQEEMPFSTYLPLLGR